MVETTNGVIWCASDEIKGGRQYFDQAVLSAKSFRDKNPGIGTAIFTSHEDLYDDVFDFHFPIYESKEEKEWTMKYLKEWSPTKRITNLKVLCSIRSPFYKTLHLDADTFVISDVSEIFDELDNYSILFTNSDRTKKNENGINIGCTELTVHNAINSGVYAFKMDDAARTVLGKQWIDIIQDRGIGEQHALTLYIRNPKKYLSGVSWKCLDNTVYNAQRRMWRSMYEYGLWDQAKILHFGSYTSFLKVYNGEMTKDDLLDLPNVKSCDPAWLTVAPRKPDEVNSALLSSEDFE